MSEIVLRRTAAEILAAAAVELFPNVLLVHGYTPSWGFCYDFVFPFAFQDSFLTLIEEKMRAIIKEGRPIKMLEMMPDNAANFLDHHGQTHRAEEVRDLKAPLATVFQMGEFIDLCDPPFLPSSNSVGIFKLLEAVCLEQEEQNYLIRIIGCTASEKSELKEALKKAKDFKEKDHICLGRDLNLFSPTDIEGIWLLHPNGECLKTQLVDFWKAQLDKQNFELISFTGSMSLKEIVSACDVFCKGEGKVALMRYFENEECQFQGMFDTLSYFIPQEFIFCKETNLLEECISSLQFIVKISKIFRFEYELVLCSPSKKGSSLWKKSEEVLMRAAKSCKFDLSVECCDLEDGPRIEVRLMDVLGRTWAGPYLGINCAYKMSSGRALVTRSTFGPVERFIALLIESCEGELPFWLSPEQVRICPVDESYLQYALDVKEALEDLKVRVVIDSRPLKLAARVHDALRERVPYCIVVGEQEKTRAAVTVRASGSSVEEKISVEDFKRMLLAKLKGNEDFENQ